MFSTSVIYQSSTGNTFKLGERRFSPAGHAHGTRCPANIHFEASFVVFKRKLLKTHLFNAPFNFVGLL
jgi:hypothetical protein